MAFAEVALGQIQALRGPATPRNFEIWHAYAAGCHPSLNQKINDLLAKNGKLTDAELEQIDETHFSSRRLSKDVENINSQMIDEIDQVMAMIDVAAGNANHRTEDVATMTEKLSNVKDRGALRVIVESLVQTAKEMEVSNRLLEERLNTSKHQINELQVSLEAVRAESLTDSPTQLANRKFFDTTLKQAIVKANDKNEPLSLMMTDIDHFKKFNDSFGHLIGDQVLRVVATLVKQSIKGRDTAARYGGEEFGIVLPNTTLRQATIVADQIRRSVMTREFKKRSTGEHLGRVTISIGIATLRKNDTAQTLIKRTDACLYAAKRHGRNRLTCETDPEVSTAGWAVQVA